jgi:hypothetical protein
MLGITNVMKIVWVASFLFGFAESGFNAGVKKFSACQRCSELASRCVRMMSVAVGRFIGQWSRDFACR